MRIIERTRKITPLESGREERERLRRQLRRLLERNSGAFDQGFQAAIAMVAAGATLERLREASGVVATDFEDTSPMNLRDGMALDETVAVDADAFDGDTDVNIELS